MNAMSIDIEQITALVHSGTLARLQISLVVFVGRPLVVIWRSCNRPIKYADVQINYNTEA